MLKWSLILNILFLTLATSSCITSPDAPKLPREPKQYIHADEPDRWCRLEGKQVECATPLNEFGLFHVEDVAMIQSYIVDLNKQCEKWSKK